MADTRTSTGRSRKPSSLEPPAAPCQRAFSARWGSTPWPCRVMGTSRRVPPELSSWFMERLAASWSGMSHRSLPPAVQAAHRGSPFSNKRSKRTLEHWPFRRRKKTPRLVTRRGVLGYPVICGCSSRGSRTTVPGNCCLSTSRWTCPHPSPQTRKEPAVKWQRP